MLAGLPAGKVMRYLPAIAEITAENPVRNRDNLYVCERDENKKSFGATNIALL